MFLQIFYIAFVAMGMPFFSSQKEKFPAVIEDEVFPKVEKKHFVLSPSGKYIAYIEKSEDQGSAIIAESIATPAHRCRLYVTLGKIKDIFWTKDEKQLLFLHKTSDKQTHLCIGDLRSESIDNITPFPDTKVSLIGFNPEKQSLLISMNLRDHLLNDLYSYNLSKKKFYLENTNPGSTIRYYADASCKYIASLTHYLDGSKALFVRDKDGEWKTLAKASSEDALLDLIALFPAEKKAIIKNSENSPTLLAQSVCWEDESIEKIASDPKYDIKDLYFATNCSRPSFYSFYGPDNTTILDPFWKRAFAHMKRYGAEEISVVSSDLSQKRFCLCLTFSDKPKSYYLFDKDTFAMRRLSNHSPSFFPQFEKQKLSFPLKDGKEIFGQWIKPLTKSKKWVIILPKTPLKADSGSFSKQSYFLVSKGYNVLELSLRGSLGYGKQFINDAKYEFGTKALLDLIEVKRFLVEKQFADSNAVALIGKGFGGYVSFFATMLESDVFCCCAAHNTPCDLSKYFLSKSFSTRAKLESFFVKDQEREQYRRTSPFSHVHQIQKPLFLSYEKESLVAKQNEWIIEKAKENNLPVVSQRVLSSNHLHELEAFLRTNLK